MRHGTRTIAALAALTIGALGFVPAQAALTCSVDGASAASPHAIDPAGDYDGDGEVFGRESTLPYGEVYREGIDLRSAWISRDASGAFQGNVRVVELSGIETNAVFYMLWTFEGNDPAQKRRFVSMQARPWGNAFRYGYLDETGAVGQFMTQGATTGTVITGVGGGFTVDIPMADMGAPGAGDALDLLAVESRMLIGSPGHGQDVTVDLPEAGPTDVPGSRSTGLVGVADDIGNADDVCGTITIPA